LFVGRHVLKVHLLLLVSLPLHAQVCRLSVAGLNQARRVTGSIQAECPSVVHSSPFGNWGVASNYGQRGNSHQFQGWCHDTRVCDNSGFCSDVCRDGWYEWNTCTVNPAFSPPNCTLYNDSGCTEQRSTMGINVHGTKTVDIPVRCPIDTNGDGVADQGGCADVKQYSTGANYMSLYELDPVCCDELVQTVYFPAATIPMTCDAIGCASQATEWLNPSSWDTPANPPKVYAEMAALVNWGSFVDDRRACGFTAPGFNVVSAASFKGPNVAPESIASAFGPQLSPVTAEAVSLPMPTALTGFVATITDSRNIERPAPLFYISPTQVNFQVPLGVAAGQARVSIFNGPALRSTSTIQIEAVSPGIFTRSANGRGLAAAVAVRVSANGAVTTLPQDLPLDLGQPTDVVHLSLYGTGIRNRGSLTGVSVTVGGLNARVEYAGLQPQYVGLDQVNVVVPHELAGRGLVDLVVTVDSKPANTVQIEIQ
jgi:uncharacterized protein (TIGR03437 family)